MTAAPLPSWLMPPPEGYTAEDLDLIPDLPPHTELIDGSLVFVSPQAFFHLMAVDGIYAALKECAPRHLLAVREMTVTLGPRQRPEPDVAVVARAALKNKRQTDFHAEDVLLVVEVVSPESEIRDRERKVQLYAQAGIPHFWRVEDEDDETVVYVHRLNAETSEYEIASVQRDRLVLEDPFPIDIDLAAATSI